MHRPFASLKSDQLTRAMARLAAASPVHHRFACGPESQDLVGWYAQTPMLLCAVGGRVMVSYPKNGDIVKAHPLATGDALFLPAGTWRHIDHAVCRNHVWISFAAAAIHLMLRQRRPGDGNPEPDAMIMLPPPAGLAELLGFLSARAREPDPGPGGQTGIAALIDLVVHELVRPGSDQQGPPQDSWERVLDWMRANASRPIGRREIAEGTRFSPDYLSHLARQRQGRSLTTVLNDLRIEMACELLNSSEARIADIARRCGFGGASYFVCQFAKRRGLTPLAYRQAARAARDP